MQKEIKFKKVKEERENLTKIIYDQTLQRFNHTLGEDCSEEDINHCAEPLMKMFEQYNIWVEDARADIEEKQKLLDIKNLEIQMLSRENEKYMIIE